MKVSIITATYNSANTVRDTIESVLSQNHTNIEYIIIDGGSKDNTLDIVYEYKGKIAKVISEQDNGIYDAMNKGISFATGDIVGILNSDDLYVDNMVISDIVKAFERKKVEAIYANLYFVKQDDTDLIVRRWKSSQYEYGAFRKGWHPAHPTFFVKNDVYKRLGGFDINFNVSADFELMLRFLGKNRITNYYLSRPVVKMRMGGESTGSIKKIIEGNINVIKAFKKNGISVSPFYPVYRLAPKLLEFINISKYENYINRRQWFRWYTTNRKS